MAFINRVISWDHSLFLFLNDSHHYLLDMIMPLLSKTLFWSPLFLWLLFKLYQKYHSAVGIILVCTVMLIWFTDQSANLCKNMVQRYRPTHHPELQFLVHTVNGYRGGLYGFFSSHAANSFGVVTFCLLLLKPSKKYLKIILILYACLTSYSRIYLGVHYPSDIITGVCYGVLTGFLFYNLTQTLLEKWYIKFPPPKP